MLRIVRPHARSTATALGPALALILAAGGIAGAQTPPVPPAAVPAPVTTPLPPKRPAMASVPAVTGLPATPPAAGAPAAPQAATGNVQTAMLAHQAFDPGALTAEQTATIRRLDDYLNGVRVMSGSFTQVAADGSRSQGKFWVSKPGKLRFEYAPPSPVELVADGRSVAVRDRKLNTQDLYYINQTPLRFLLADRLDLVQDANLVNLTGDAETITATLEEKSSVGGSSRIALMFSAADYSLKQWTVTDPQGFDTTVAVYDVDTRSSPPEKLFFIDEHRTL